MRIPTYTRTAGNRTTRVDLHEANTALEQASSQKTAPAAIGSDGTREMLNYIFARATGADRALLFDMPGAELREVS